MHLVENLIDLISPAPTLDSVFGLGGRSKGRDIRWLWYSGALGQGRMEEL